jgi:Ras-related protein Rab-5C
MMKRPTPHTIHAKVVILGESSVGKTSVVMRGTRGEFYELQEPTIGAAFFTTERTVHGTLVRLELWDTAGQERYRSLAPMYYRGSSMAIVMYDITQPDSLVRAREWVAELSVKFPDKSCRLVLVGNKSDLGEVSERMADMAREVVRDHTDHDSDPIQHMLVSAKTGDGVERLFEHVCETVYNVEGNGGGGSGGSGSGGNASNGFVLGDGNARRGGRGYIDRIRGMCG